MKILFAVYICLLAIILTNANAESTNKNIVSAQVKSCPGCSLNRLPEVRAFIYEDLPKYGIEFVKIHGHKPELIFLNDEGQEVDSIPLSDLNREQCNELLTKNGFKIESEEKKIVKAVVKSCPGCSLNRLTEVKAFIYDDLPKYENVEFIKIHGHKPELIYLDDADEEIETIPLSDLNREECNKLLTSRGFKQKDAKSEL